MKKPIKVLLFGLGILVFSYVGYTLISFITLGHHIENQKFEQYLWLLKDSVRKDIDTFFWSGEVRNGDILYDYIYKNNYLISVWEFKGLNGVELNEINISQNVNIGKIKFFSWEIFNKNSSYRPKITMKLGFSLKHLTINLDEESKITKKIEGPNYKGFYGIINRMSFNDESKPLIFFEYPREQDPIFLMLYKTTKSFYVIFINSKNKRLTDEIIKILNFN